MPPPYPWDESGKPEPGTEDEATAGWADDLPAAGEIFDPAAQSEGAGEDPPTDAERLNENIEQLLETVDAFAADVAESRSHLERLASMTQQFHGLSIRPRLPLIPSVYEISLCRGSYRALQACGTRASPCSLPNSHDGHVATPHCFPFTS